MINEVILNDRFLLPGTECEYISSVINGTGVTWGKCVVAKVLDPDWRIYQLKEIGNNPREWVVQDVNEKAMLEKIGKNCVSLARIVVKEEKSDL